MTSKSCIMEPVETSELSVTQWLRDCVMQGHFCKTRQNPFHREYWSDFTHYHGNMAHLLRRCWEWMPQISDELTWHSILCVEQAYEDYEGRILRGEITFHERENAKRDLRPKVFLRKLLAILKPADFQVFQLTVPEEVTRRIEDTINGEPFRQAPVLTPRETRRCGESRTPMEKPGIQRHPLTFVIVGTRDSVVQKIDNCSVLDKCTTAISKKRKRECSMSNEFLDQKRNRTLHSS